MEYCYNFFLAFSVSISESRKRDLKERLFNFNVELINLESQRSKEICTNLFLWFEIDAVFNQRLSE